MQWNVAGARMRGGGAHVEATGVEKANEEDEQRRRKKKKKKKRKKRKKRRWERRCEVSE